MYIAVQDEDCEVLVLAAWSWKHITLDAAVGMYVRNTTGPVCG